jgi:two-component system sensor histidine kinase KdpD
VRLQKQVVAARLRERRTAALFSLSRDLASLRGLPSLLAAARRHISAVFEGRVTLLLPSPSGPLSVQESSGDGAAMDGAEMAVAEWCFAHGQMAGHGTGTLPGAGSLYLPLGGAHGTVGVLGLQPGAEDPLDSPERLHLLEAFANQTALAVERAHLADEAALRQVQAETEQMRSALLSAVSHDLRTPLATITGAASLLLERDSGPRADAPADVPPIDTAERRELLSAIVDESERLNRLVGNLLEMTRLESGHGQVRREWHSLEEIVGAALGRVERALAGRKVTTTLPADLPLVDIDGLLMELVLINLLENAAKHTPPGTPIALVARATDHAVEIAVADRGPGVRPGEEASIFQRFHRGAGAEAGGSGLGLAVCAGIVDAHGGRISAKNRPGGGLEILVTLPLVGEAPTVGGPAALDLAQVVGPGPAGASGDDRGGRP